MLILTILFIIESNNIWVFTMFKTFLNALNDLRLNTRKHGLRYALKDIFKKYGWKAGVIIFMYYIIRDVTLYIIIPYLVGKGFFESIQ